MSRKNGHWRPSMHEAILYEKLMDKEVSCLVCPRACRIKDGDEGYCCIRGNRNGALFALAYGLCSSIAVDPIEKKPVYHYRPGSQVLSYGTIGCNLRCRHCQNWQIAHETTEGLVGLEKCDPKTAADAARSLGCEGVAWTYNEPTIWLEHTIDAAKVCREAGIYTVYVTNGYITIPALDAVAPYLDVYRVDIKAFSDQAYLELADIRSVKPILNACRRAKNKWQLHVEVVTNVIPGLNDDDSQLTDLARWIFAELGPDTPWHITRFFPYLGLSHLEPTPISTLERARAIGIGQGLFYVYLGNVPDCGYEDTICPRCGAKAIERRGYLVALENIDKCGRCSRCGQDLSVRGL